MIVSIFLQKNIYIEIFKNILLLKKFFFSSNRLKNIKTVKVYLKNKKQNFFYDLRFFKDFLKDKKIFISIICLRNFNFY